VDCWFIHVDAAVIDPSAGMRAGALPSSFLDTPADKGTGIARALAGMGIDPSHALGFGDSINDLPMFALLGYTVAVANAHPDLRHAADG
jgi:hydroxymethylpyrimidine pyrophosphatase-like HAD family hydrolase